MSLLRPLMMCQYFGYSPALAAVSGVTLLARLHKGEYILTISKLKNMARHLICSRPSATENMPKIYILILILLLIYWFKVTV